MVKHSRAHLLFHAGRVVDVIAGGVQDLSLALAIGRASQDIWGRKRLARGLLRSTVAKANLTGKGESKENVYFLLMPPR